MSENNFLNKALDNTVLNRRSFLKWSGALGGTAVLAGDVSYGFKAVEAATEAATAEEKWVAAACWHNCGGRCLNVALVQDGVVIRQKTDDTHPDSPDFPQQRGCSRGRSQRQQVFGADRLKYPMKRKNWEPGGGKKELRGKDEWVRISWDEALDIVASEIKRIQGTYGNKAIFTPRFESRLLNAYGGATSSWGVTSAGAFPQVQSLMAGNAVGPNDRLDYRNAKLVVMWGSNPISSSGGNPAYNYLQAKRAGAKFIFIDPRHQESTQVLADDWVPVRPGTDTALLLAIAHYMIEHNLQDQAFLDKYAVGFDADHMPEGADPKENFKDYVLGTYDGVPKTPEWAAEICGTSPRKIRQLAHEVATTKPMVWSTSWAPGRTHRGQQYVQAFLAVGWMTGNVGLPGAAVCVATHNGASYGGSRLVRPGSSGVSGIPNPLAGGVSLGYAFAHPENTEFEGIAYEEMWDAILNNEYHATVRGVIPCDLRMIYMVRGGSGSNSLNQVSGINKGIEAFRKVEFVVSNDIVLSTVSKYADVVLPATTPWEQEGGGGIMTGNPETIFVNSQVTDPLYEARSENWMDRELAKRLGLDPDLVDPVSSKQQAFNQIAGATVMADDGSGYEPLVTITAADIAELGVEGEPQRGRISYKELVSKGLYQVSRSPGDNFGFISNKEFREDPEANPLATASGKLEIHCQPLSDKIAAYGFTKDLSPIPKYIPPEEGVEATYTDWDKKIKGNYPLQFFTPHYFRRSHSVFDNIIQLRKAFPQEFMMNPIDAAERGIAHGDTVLITTKHGKALRPVCVTERILPGVIALGEGAWVERDDETGIDKAGATNSLNGVHLTGQGEEPWNTAVAQVEKWTGDPHVPDAEWPQRIPIEEA